MFTWTSEDVSGFGRVIPQTVGARARAAALEAWRGRPDQTHSVIHRELLDARTIQPLADRGSGRIDHGGDVAHSHATNLVYNIYPDRNGVLSWTHSFSATFFSEFLFSDSWEYLQFYTGTAANSDVDSVLGLPNPFNGAGWPSISGTGYGTTYSASTPRKTVTNVYSGHENPTKSWGRHKIEFGGGIRFEHDNVYAQDEFKLHNRLTLSYGLRYEYRPPISEARDNIMGFDKAKDAVVLALSEDQMIQKGYTMASVYNQFLAIGMKTETPQQAGLPHVTPWQVSPAIATPRPLTLCHWTTICTCLGPCRSIPISSIAS